MESFFFKNIINDRALIYLSVAKVFIKANVGTFAHIKRSCTQHDTVE